VLSFLTRISLAESLGVAKFKISIFIFMTTATIEIKNDIAFGLLQYLESVNILRVLDKSNRADKTLGDFFGAMPEETCQKLEEHAKKARSEWNRIF